MRPLTEGSEFAVPVNCAQVYGEFTGYPTNITPEDESHFVEVELMGNEVLNTDALTGLEDEFCEIQTEGASLANAGVKYTKSAVSLTPDVPRTLVYNRSF